MIGSGMPAMKKSCALKGKRGGILICVLILLILFAIIRIDRPSVQAQGDPINEVIVLVNQLRDDYGQPPYQVDPILMRVAQAHASWSAANNISSHLGPDGKNPDERAKAAGMGLGRRHS